MLMVDSVRERPLRCTRALDQVLSTSVTSASTASSDATANAAANWYSL